MPVPLDTRKAVALLAYLAVTGQAHTRQALAGLLWPDYPAERARASLRRTLSTLNTGLGQEWLETRRDTVRLPRHGVWVDVEQFHALRGPQAQTTDRRARLTEAVSLYRGDFLSGFGLRDSPEFDDWQFYTVESLRRDLADALEQLTRECAAVGDFSSAVAQGRRWLSLDTLHEPAHRALMSIYARSDRRAAALRQYRECVRLLDRELGVAPLEETQALYQAIREHRLESSTAPAAGADPRAGHSATGTARVGAMTEPEQPPLIGRDSERSALRSAHAAATDGHVAVLQGEVGIGKTRLLEDLTAWAAGGDAAAVSVRCFPGERSLAYGPFLDLLRGLTREPTMKARLSEAQLPLPWWQEAVRLLPELSYVAPRGPAGDLITPPDDGGGQTQLFDAVAGLVSAACAQTSPSVIAFDDVHWADEASMDLLVYLLRRLRGTPVLLVLTWREDELPATHRLPRAVRELHDTTVLSLPRLGAKDVDRLVDAMCPSAGAALRERLYEETEGVPFFVVAYLAVLPTEPEPGWSLPSNVRDLLAARVADLDAAARQLLTACSVVGEPLDFDALRAVSGRGDDETVAGLEELLARGLVREWSSEAGGEARYDVSHKLLREHAYATSSLARRRLLHRRAGAVLTERLRGGGDTVTLRARIAQHFQRGGDDENAALHYVHAGEAARATHAHAEAVEYLRSAIALGHPDAGRLHELIGDLHAVTGNYHDALQSFEAAAALSTAPLADPTPLASLERKLGRVRHRLGEWDSAEAHYATALDLLGDNGRSERQGLRSRTFADWSLTAHRRGNLDAARELANRALSLAEDAGDHLALVSALNHLSLTLAGAGEVDEALALARRAVADVAPLEDRHLEASLENNLADLLRTAGCDEEADQRTRRCAELLEGVDAEVGDLRPEAWPLAG